MSEELIMLMISILASVGCPSPTMSDLQPSNSLQLLFNFTSLVRHTDIAVCLEAVRVNMIQKRLQKRDKELQSDVSTIG